MTTRKKPRALPYPVLTDKQREAARKAYAAYAAGKWHDPTLRDQWIALSGGEA